MYQAPIDLKLRELTPVDLFMSGDIMLTSSDAPGTGVTVITAAPGKQQ
jgi:hypothetical protein